MEDTLAYESLMPKTVANKVDLMYRISNHAALALKNTYELNRFGNMVERYGHKLPEYIRAKNYLSETTDYLTTGIYEGKKGTDLI